MVELACAGLDRRRGLTGRGGRTTGRRSPRTPSSASQAPDRELFLLLGADAVANMPTWRRLEETRGSRRDRGRRTGGRARRPAGAGLAVRARHDPTPGRLVVRDPVAGSPPGSRSTGSRRRQWCEFIRDTGPLHSRLMAQSAGGTVLDEPPPGSRRERRKQARPRARPPARLRAGGRADRSGRRAPRRAGSRPNAAGSGSCSMPAVAMLLGVDGRGGRADPIGRRGMAGRVGEPRRWRRRTGGPSTLLLAHRGADGRSISSSSSGAVGDRAASCSPVGDPGRGPVARAARRSRTFRTTVAPSCSQTTVENLLGVKVAKTVVARRRGVERRARAGGPDDRGPAPRGAVRRERRGDRSRPAEPQRTAGEAARLLVARPARERARPARHRAGRARRLDAPPAGARGSPARPSGAQPELAALVAAAKRVGPAHRHAPGRVGRHRWRRAVRAADRRRRPLRRGGVPERAARGRREPAAGRDPQRHRCGRPGPDDRGPDRPGGRSGDAHRQRAEASGSRRRRSSTTGTRTGPTRSGCCDALGCGVAEEGRHAPSE